MAKIKGNQRRDKTYQRVTKTEKKGCHTMTKMRVHGLPPFAYPLLRHVDSQGLEKMKFVTFS